MTRHPHNAILDEAGHGLFARDGSVSLYLPPHPYRLLVCLTSHSPGRVVSYAELQRAVFPDDECWCDHSDDRLRYHVGVLRKIAVCGGWPAALIITRADVGVQLDARIVWHRQTPGD